MPIPPATPHSPDEIWLSIRASAERAAREEPMLASFLHATILNHDTLEAALSFHLAQKLDNPAAPALLVREVIEQAFASDPSIGAAIRCDLRAVNERDSACPNHAVAFLFFKGFHALESYRIAHWLWQQQRRPLALFLQNRISCEFGVDIHPAASKRAAKRCATRRSCRSRPRRRWTRSMPRCSRASTHATRRRRRSRLRARRRPVT